VRCFVGGGMSWCHGGATSTDVTSTGNASPVKESNDTMATKCERLISGFSQCSVVLRCELWCGSNKGCMVFKHERWLIFMQGVCGDYT